MMFVSRETNHKKRSKVTYWGAKLLFFVFCCFAVVVAAAVFDWWCLVHLPCAQKNTRQVNFISLTVWLDLFHKISEPRWNNVWQDLKKPKRRSDTAWRIEPPSPNYEHANFNMIYSPFQASTPPLVFCAKWLPRFVAQKIACSISP